MDVCGEERRWVTEEIGLEVAECLTVTQDPGRHGMVDEGSRRKKKARTVVEVVQRPDGSPGVSVVPRRGPV